MLVLVGTGLFGDYGKHLAGERHTVRDAVRQDKAEQVTCKTLRGEYFCWKYHDIGSTHSGYSVLHVQSGRCFRSNNDYTVQQRDSSICYLFWNQYEQYQVETRRKGNRVSATSR